MGIDPVSLAIIATVASTAFSAVGSIVQGQAAASAADFNKTVADQNRALALQQAGVAEAAQRRKSRFAVGLNRANLGASGLLAEGSFLDIAAENAVTAEFNALTIRQQGDVEAVSFGNEAALQKAAARSARVQGFIGAGSALLAGGSRAAELQAGRK